MKFTTEATGRPEDLAVEVSPVSLLVLPFIFSWQGHQHSPLKLFSIKHFNAYQSSQKPLTIDSEKHVYQKTLFEKYYTVNFAPSYQHITNINSASYLLLVDLSFFFVFAFYF